MSDYLEDPLRDIRQTTKNLMESIWCYDPLTPATRVDFGIDSEEHWQALRNAVRRSDISHQDLDDALGNGKKLTALVNSVEGCNPHQVRFETSWDAIYGRDGQTTNRDHLDSGFVSEGAVALLQLAYLDEPLDDEHAKAFGVVSSEHLHTLVGAIKSDKISIMELDAVASHGGNITKFLDRENCNPLKLEFEQKQTKARKRERGLER